MHATTLLPAVALLLLSGSVHGQLDQGIAAATAAQAGQLNEAVQNLSNTVSGQLRDVVQALAKSGQLPIAAQTIAGFVSHTFCEGDFVSGRPFESVWDTDACLYNCLAHQIFNVTSPKSGAGTFSINDTAKYVNASVLTSSTSTVYTSKHFGCQLRLEGQPATQPALADDGQPPSGLQWPDATAGSQNRSANVDYDALDAAVARYFEDPALVQGAKTRAIVVIYKGQLVAERYSAAQGVDAATPLISWSLAKSVTSAVLGVRTAEPGLAPFSVTQLAGSPVWNASETAARNITLDDLLRMSSGIDWNEAASISSGGGNSPVNAAGEMLFEQADGAAFVGSLRQNSTPGQYFNYSTGNYQLLQWNLRKSFDNDSAYWSFAYNRLFKRIGAQSFVFQADPSGTLLGGSHVFMDARDWARFGQLFLQDGVWEGQRILPEGWVAYSTQPTPAASFYGAGWWRGYPGAPADSFYGNGLLGQRVIVAPDQELVIVRLGLNLNNDFDPVYGHDFFTGISAAFPDTTDAAGVVSAVQKTLGSR